MKTLNFFVPLLSLVLIFATVNAKPKPDDGALTKTHAVAIYINAMTRGDLDGFDEVVDPSATFTTLRRNNSLLCFSKKDMLGFLKKISGIEEDCLTESTIVENCPDMLVVKVDMKFDSFTRSNYVSAVNTGKGWKITNVYTVYKVNS